MTNLEEVDGVRLHSETITKYRLDLDADELAVLYGLVDAVKNNPDENKDAVDRLKSLFSETHGQWYPGYYVFVDQNETTEELDLHND